MCLSISLVVFMTFALLQICAATKQSRPMKFLPREFVRYFEQRIKVLKEAECTEEISTPSIK